MKPHLSFRPPPHRRRHGVISPVTLIILLCTVIILLLHSRTPSFPKPDSLDSSLQIQSDEYQPRRGGEWPKPEKSNATQSRCATVEEMGQSLSGSGLESEKESLRIRDVIRRHFDINGAKRVRQLPPKEFCRHGFVLGKASEAGFGNEMYKILTGATLSIMLNRSLIIGQTRHNCTLTPVLSLSYLLRVSRKSLSPVLLKSQSLYKRVTTYIEYAKCTFALNELFPLTVQMVSMRFPPPFN